MRQTCSTMICLVTVLLVGCRSSNSSATDPAAPQRPDGETAPTGIEPGEAIPLQMYAGALADCAARSGKNEDTLRVVRAEVVTWRDGSLGCPAPGLGYSQALVDGFWLVISDGELEYDYRAGRGGSFMYCAHPQAGPAPDS